MFNLFNDFTLNLYSFDNRKTMTYPKKWLSIIICDFWAKYHEIKTLTFECKMFYKYELMKKIYLMKKRDVLLAESPYIDFWCFHFYFYLQTVAKSVKVYQQCNRAIRYIFTTYKLMTRTSAWEKKLSNLFMNIIYVQSNESYVLYTLGKYSLRRFKGKIEHIPY